MKTFNEIIAMAEINKKEADNLGRIREQRQLAGEILAGVLFNGFHLTETELAFVYRCNRSMRPVDEPTLSALRKINERRWITEN